MQGRMLKIVLTIAVIAMGGLAAQVAMPKLLQREVSHIVLNQEVDPFVAGVLEAEVRDAYDHDRNLVFTITSPGGAVFPSMNIETMLATSKGRTVTYVSSYAFSMGAEFWIHGKERYIEPDAIVLFHAPSSGTSLPFLVALRHLLEIELGNQVPGSVEAALVIAKIRDVVDEYNMMMALLHRSTHFLSLSTGIARDKLYTMLYGDLSRNMIFTGQQLYDMGIATHLGRPPL